MLPKNFEAPLMKLDMSPLIAGAMRTAPAYLFGYSSVRL